MIVCYIYLVEMFWENNNFFYISVLLGAIHIDDYNMGFI